MMLTYTCKTSLTIMLIKVKVNVIFCRGLTAIIEGNLLNIHCSLSIKESRLPYNRNVIVNNFMVKLS